ncbi:MAG: DUF4143 domain-containing protein, partial [Chromatiales bacterium]
ETPDENLWIRGGFPDSLLAADDKRSLIWRQNFIRTYLERDVPRLGPRIAAETLRRFWVMLAHTQGGLLNAASLARGLDVSGKTLASYLDLMVDLLLVRRLPPWHKNVGKRLVKSPKVFVRDSGVLHALLGLRDKEAVISHPIVGASWEGYVIENLINVAPAETEACFYRASGGAEVDLILTLPGKKPWVVEVKRSLEPRLTKGFYFACDDIQPEARYVVYPGEESFALAKDVMAVSLPTLAMKLSEH